MLVQHEIDAVHRLVSLYFICCHKLTVMLMFVFQELVSASISQNSNVAIVLFYFHLLSTSFPRKCGFLIPGN